jgi:hypothetical protein
VLSLYPLLHFTEIYHAPDGKYIDGIDPLKLDGERSLCWYHLFGKWWDVITGDTSNNCKYIIYLCEIWDERLNLRRKSRAFGSAAINLGGATTTSLNGIGWTSGIGDPSLSYFRFDVFSTNISGASSTLFFASGAGATFTGNTTFAGADLTFGFQINNGNLERRTGTGSGAWTAVPYSFSNSVGYTIQILGNRSGATQNYGLGSLANNSMDFFVNGVLVGDDWSFKDSSKAIDGFRIYQVNGGGRYQLDNIVIANDFTAVPEPSSFLLTAIATWLPFQLSRNRRRAKVTAC